MKGIIQHSLLVSLILFSANSIACGGFFCQILPINQAGEQIIFRQDGNQITTMVQIQYTGAAEEFGWVLPVPNTPELSIGSDTTFAELEFATRPQFFLDFTGDLCPVPLGRNPSTDGSNFENDEDPGVVIEESLEVGPFDALIISGEDPDAVANWLEENNLDLSDRGSELIEPYVEAGMKFVVLKLQSNRDVGDIQPIIMSYESDKPMIPIRLTAVAAQDDMGIIVWLLGESRAVPENFLHVVPNYTRLNWFAGSFNAYANYQTLITDAMDEAGGHGFATDYAGQFENLTDQLTTPDALNERLSGLQSLSPAEFIADLWLLPIDPSIPNEISTLLPLSEDMNIFIYSDPVALSSNFTQDQLNTARVSLLDIIDNQIVIPLENSIDILDDNRYLTRLYTTLSADEMTVDPVFVFNADLEGQQLDRRATLDAQCDNGVSKWTLTLGEGTGRDGEVVISGTGDLPFAGPVIEQDAAFEISKTFASGPSEIVTSNDFNPVSIGGSSSSGGSAGLVVLVIMSVLSLSRRRSSK